MSFENELIEIQIICQVQLQEIHHAERRPAGGAALAFRPPLAHRGQGRRSKNQMTHQNTKNWVDKT